MFRIRSITQFFLLFLTAWLNSEALSISLRNGIQGLLSKVLMRGLWWRPHPSPWTGRQGIKLATRTALNALAALHELPNKFWSNKHPTQSKAKRIVIFPFGDISLPAHAYLYHCSILWPVTKKYRRFLYVRCIKSYLWVSGVNNLLHL